MDKVLLSKDVISWAEDAFDFNCSLKCLTITLEVNHFATFTGVSFDAKEVKGEITENNNPILSNHFCDKYKDYLGLPAQLVKAEIILEEDTIACITLHTYLYRNIDN